MSTMVDRMIRASRLDSALYEEVEADKGALGQAMGVVILSSLAAGIAGVRGLGAIGGLVIGTLFALLSWYVWAYLIYVIGTKFLPEPQTKSDLGELLRTIGFASAPGVIRIVGVIPPLRAIVFVVAAVWMVVAMVIAVRQALDYSGTGRAIGVCLIGFVVEVVVVTALMWLFGIPAASAMG